MILKGNTSKIQLLTAQASTIHVLVDYTDYIGGNDLDTIDNQSTAITTATTTDIVSVPAVGKKREITGITIANNGASNTITIYQNENGTQYKKFNCTIGIEEELHYTKHMGWRRFNKRGVEITEASEPSYPVKTHTFMIQKNTIGAAEAVGFYHFLGTATGLLGPWAVGESGLAGRAVLKSEEGFLRLPTTANKLVLAKNGLKVSPTVPTQLVDILFVNNGLVVTTTTEQTLNTVPIAARDNDGGANGLGCIWGLLVAAATTNASAIANMTFSYTNELGVAGRTGTVVNFPATAVLGTFVVLQPQAGDYGISSIQTFTLGTTLTAGAVSLVCLRIVDSVYSLLANSEDQLSSARKIALTGNEALTVMMLAVGASSYTIVPSEILINEY